MINFDEISPDLKDKAKQCKTPEELLALAGSAGIKLSEEELDAVSGGSWSDWNGCLTDCADVHAV